MIIQSPPAARNLLPLDAMPSATTFLLTSERARIRLWFAAALLAADFLQMSLGFWGSSAGTPWWQHEYKAFYSSAIHAFVWWTCICIADAVSPMRMSPKFVYALACLVATAVSTAIWIDFYAATSTKGDFTRNQWLNWWWQITLFSLWKFAMATSAYVYFQDGESGRSTLQRLRLERAEVMRKSTESKLQAMQARINPEFLFTTLEDVGRRCDTNPDSADHVLACLIAYLRASTPVSMESSLTIGTEIALVRTYLDLVEARHHPRFTYGIDLAADAGNAQLPAMLMLPLVEHATVAALRAAGPATLSLRVELDINRKRLFVTAHFTDIAAGHGSDNAVLAIGKRLDELFGNSASLASADAGSGTKELAMEIPYERT